ncbi:hypothetical protein QTP88_010717 [Uroleucon formosanum]
MLKRVSTFLTSTPSQIFAEVINQVPEKALTSFENEETTKRMLRRHKNKGNPKKPSCLSEFTIKNEWAMYKDERFLLFDNGSGSNERIIIFSLDEELIHLSEADTWFCDVDYKSHNKAWMTGDIFSDWLKEWDKQLAKEKRHILLTVDNYPAHPPAQTEFIKLVFLSPNTTSVLQPMNEENLNSQSTTSLNDFDQPNTSSSNINSDSMSNINFISNYLIRRKRQKLNKQNITSDKLLSPERTEEIHKALSKMIAMNLMPLSFYSSPGFKYFMNVVDPNYKPCSAESVKNRLKLLTSDIRQLIKNELNEVTSVSCTTDCWTSIF